MPNIKLQSIASTLVALISEQAIDLRLILRDYYGIEDGPLSPIVKAYYPIGPAICHFDAPYSSWDIKRLQNFVDELTKKLNKSNADLATLKDAKSALDLRYIG